MDKNFSCSRQRGSGHGSWVPPAPNSLPCPVRLSYLISKKPPEWVAFFWWNSIIYRRTCAHSQPLHCFQRLFRCRQEGNPFISTPRLLLLFIFLRHAFKIGGCIISPAANEFTILIENRIDRFSVFPNCAD